MTIAVILRLTQFRYSFPQLRPQTSISKPPVQEILPAYTAQESYGVFPSFHTLTGIRQAAPADRGRA